MQSTGPTWILASTAFQVLDPSFPLWCLTCTLTGQPFASVYRAIIMTRVSQNCTLQEEQRLWMTSSLAYDLNISTQGQQVSFMASALICKRASWL